MAVRVELWREGRLAGGLEEWWDRVEIALPDDRATKYPLLSRVDPYGNVVYLREELEPLAAELRAFLADSPESLRKLFTDLIALCDDGLSGGDAHLKFLGD